jgi:hypothetical protein
MPSKGSASASGGIVPRGLVEALVSPAVDAEKRGLSGGAGVLASEGDPSDDGGER